MRMEEGLDTGPVYLMRTLPITPEDTAGSLHDKLAALGAECIVEALPGIADGSLPFRAQPETGVAYAAKIAKEEAAIDWSAQAAAIDRHIRAFNPFPGAASLLRGEAVKVWSARPAGANASGRVPGTVIAATADGIEVACGEGTLRLTELQRAGARRMQAAEFLRGVPVAAGERFGA
jgi:methionyl-tRNA formyltransferase